MSRSMGKQSLVKAFAKRYYSAAPATKAASSSAVDVHLTSKKIKLVTCNENDPLVKISFSFKAGSRYETPEILGLNHVLRKAVGLSTLDVFPFNITRNLQQYGVNCYASTDRENYIVTVETRAKELSGAFFYLNTIATKPAFKPWEISDNKKRILLDILSVPPEAKVMDNLHTVAYRDGLGNSLFIPESRIGQIKSEHLMHFFNEHCTGPRLQITASGLSITALNELVTEVEIEENAGPSTTPQKYFGGENRIYEPTEHHAYIAVIGETPGFSKKEYLPFAVLKHVYSNPPAFKYGVGQGIINRALYKSGAFGTATGINASYSDSGLVGFFIITNGYDATKAVDSVMDAFLKVEISDNDINRAKNQLKASVLNNSGLKTVDFLANQTGQDTLVTPEQLVSAINSVTSADVKRAAKKVAESKLTMVSYGDTRTVPYLDKYKK